MEEKIVRKCARCGCEIPLKSPSIFLIDGASQSELIDLCRPCFFAFKGWIDGGVIDGN